jgi:hypothetical protein
LILIGLQVQLERFIAAWNLHPIPKSGVPSAKLESKKNYILAEGVLPKVADAVALYQLSHPTANFTNEHHFVEDIIPIGNRIERDELFDGILDRNLEGIVNSVANNDHILFVNCFLELTAIQDSFFMG